MASSHYHPLRSLYLSRLREFYRQPARIFWVYGFPTILAIVLGLAFNSRPPESIPLDLVRNAHSAGFEAKLKAYDSQARSSKETGLQLNVVDEAEGERRLRTGKTPLLVVPVSPTEVAYRYDRTRPEASVSRLTVDNVLQRAQGRQDLIRTVDKTDVPPGSRYIDFLIPGLIGMNTMGGGLWGVGFLLVNFRIGKLLKRFQATPMPRKDFLLAILGARLTFLVPDVAVLLILGVAMFGMPVHCDPILFVLVEIVGALAFAGIGLLVASRAETTETVSGLMNLVMLPMWLLSGVFFSSERFPAAVQPIVQALPLTQLLQALRAMLLEGAGWGSPVVWTAVLVLGLWAVVTFLLALRWFKWS